VVAEADDDGDMYASMSSTSSSYADGGAPSSDQLSCISLLKNYCSNGLSPSIATVQPQ
jgi:hypothetical protein